MNQSRSQIDPAVHSACHKIILDPCQDQILSAVLPAAVHQNTDIDRAFLLFCQPADLSAVFLSQIGIGYIDKADSAGTGTVIAYRHDRDPVLTGSLD